MLRKASPVRPAFCKDDPLADDPWRPPAALADHGSQSAASIRHTEELVHVNELGLQLYEQQHLLLGVPRHEVDDATLAVVAERHFRTNLPARITQESGHRLGHRCVAACKRALERAAPPSGVEHELDLEHAGDPPQLAHGEPVEVAAFDQ